jgi:hypothetical protein
MGVLHNVVSYLFVFCNRFWRKFNNFEVTAKASVNRKADERSYRLPPVCTRCSRVDVKQVERRVAYDFQNVRVPSYEEVGRITEEFVGDASVVLAWVSAYVFHHYFYLLASEA